jgi:Right handed beta helix region
MLRYMHVGLTAATVLIGASIIGAADAAQPACKAINQTKDVSYNSKAYGDPLATAIAEAGSGDTLKVIGTCTGNFSITKDLTLTGRPSRQQEDVLDGGGNGTVLGVVGDVDVTVGDLTITGGTTGISNTAADLVLTRIAVTRNHVGITSSVLGSVTIDDSLVSGNAGDGVVGGLFGTIDITDSVVSNNAGAGVAGLRTAVTVSDSTIANNSRGGISSRRSVDITRSVIEGNTNLDGVGAGVAIGDLGSLQLTDSIVRGNTAAQGGGIWIQLNGSPTIITRSLITGNHATEDGGGINGPGEYPLVIVDSVVSNNTATRGGGLFLWSPMKSGTTEISNSRVTGNSAVYGGGIWNDQPLTLTESRIMRNAASTAGGGIYNGPGGTISSFASIVSENTPDDIVGAA